MNKYLMLLLTIVLWEKAYSENSYEIEAGTRFYTVFSPQAGFSLYDGKWKYTVLLTNVKRDGESWVSPRYNDLDTITSYTFDTKFVGVKVNRFIGDSFYVSGELQYGSGEVKTDLMYLDSDLNLSNEKDEFEYKTAFYSFSFGNNWRWEKFSIDWAWANYERYMYHRLDGESIKIRDLFYKERGMILVSKLALGVRF